MTKEALKLALEALEDLGMKHYEITGEVLYKDTFTAIKEALAQPEHIGFMDSKLNPIQRTWVGLTDEEIDKGLLRSDYAFKTAEAWRAGVVFAMTKLKEKNT